MHRQRGNVASILPLAAIIGALTLHQAAAQVGPPRVAPPLGNANPVPQGSPLPGISAPALPGVAPATPPALAAPGTVAPSQIVAITDVGVDGATAYTDAALARYTAGLTGPAIQVQRIEAARTAILNRYRTDGYVYTAVNARIHGTHLRFVVTEGRIVSVKLDGDIGPAGVQVLRFLNHLTDLQPISARALERWLLLANDVPGVTVRAILNPSAEDPGALTLIAEVQRRAVTGELSADNRAFRQTGPEQLLAVVDLNSFSEFGERTEFSMYHTFNNTDNFGQASEDVFIGGSGLRIHVYGGDGESIPSGSLRSIGYDGITRVFGADLSYPLIRQRQQTLLLHAQFDGIESQITTDTGIDFRPARASFDSLRILRAGLDDTLLDTLAGPRFSATDVFAFRLSQGLPTLGASANGNIQLPRIGERVDFTKISGSAERDQSLFAINQDSTVSLKVALEGQFTRNILPPEEKLYLGGPHFNRGFYYGEVTGDSALAASIEPTLDTKLPAPAFIHLPLDAEFYGFYDWGETWETSNLDQDHVLRSIGGGVRLYLGSLAEIDLEGVSRLTRTPNGPPPLVSRLQSSAFYWQVIGHF
jgi:hemolysin activation/secretion protein